MKKAAFSHKKPILIAISLVLGLVLPLGGCASAGADNTYGSTAETILETLTTDPQIDSNFLAGFGVGDITPTEPVPLQGYGDSSLRVSTNVQSSLYAHCLMVTDETGTSAMMISVDSAAVGTELCTIIRGKIRAKTGIPVPNIIISANHQHSTPDYANSKFESAGRYYDLMVERIVQAAVDAFADRLPAEMYITSVETKNLNFVRNYVKDENGNLAHESEADATLQLLKFVRGGGKKDIIVANFQGHPHMGTSASNTIVHSDTVGVFRSTLTDLLDCNVMYFSGAGGNIDMTSRIPREIKYSNINRHGEKLADYAAEAEGTYIKAETGKVQAKMLTAQYNTDKSLEHLYERAVEFMEIWNSKGQLAAQAALKDFPEFNSIYHGKYVVIKHNLEQTRRLTIYALSFGDVAFVGAPFEMFDTNGDEIKSGSPFKMTIVATQANGCDGYVPSQLGYDNGGYSTDITRYAEGTGELVAQNYISLLQWMYDFR